MAATIKGPGGAITAKQGGRDATAQAWLVELLDPLSLEGIASEATLDQVRSVLDNLFTKLEAVRVLVDAQAALSETQPVSVGTLPLPSGAATAANQSEIADRLDTLIGNTDGLEVSLTDVDLNTDQIETQLTSIFNELLEKLEAGDVTGLATAAHQLTQNSIAQAIRDRLPASLDGGSLSVADAYTDGEALASQVGDDTVRTFTLTEPRDLIWVRSVGGVSYADPFGGTPADGTGIYLADDEPTPITVRAQVVKVWAPTGSTVHVWGYGG